MIGLKKFSGGFFRSVKVKSGKKYQNDRMDVDGDLFKSLV